MTKHRHPEEADALYESILGIGGAGGMDALYARHAATPISHPQAEPASLYGAVLHCATCKRNTPHLWTEGGSAICGRCQSGRARR